MLRVSLFGIVQIRDDEGHDFTPDGSKTRALVALLMSSDDFRRPRSWLQDMLWSDRGPAQGQQSLRQALTALRKALGPHRDAVLTAKGCIQLDPARVVIADTDGWQAGRCFCEDLGDVIDRQFENWLRDRRMHYESLAAERPPPPEPTPEPHGTGHRAPILVVSVEQSLGGMDNASSLTLRNDIVRSVLEMSEVRVLDLNSGRPVRLEGAGPGVFLRVSAVAEGENLSVSARVETLSGNWIIWQSPTTLISRTESADEDIWRLRCLGQTCVARIQDEFERQIDSHQWGNTALGLANRALNTLFGFRKQDLIDADNLFRTAYELEPRGVYLSWRAFIRNTAIFEHLTDDFLEPCEAYELHATALGDDPLNSFSLVFAGQHCFVNEGDPKFGQSLCDKALEINPGNAMGWGFRSNMLLLQDEPELAAEAARRGAVLAEGQPFKPTLAVNSCLSEIAIGRYHEAIVHGRMSQMSPTKCQAIRRFLFALYRALDMPVDAERQCAALRLREPDFKPEDLLRSDYPTWTLQRMKLLDKI